MYPTAKNLLIGFVYLWIVPSVLYVLGVNIPWLSDGGSFFSALGIFFGMRGMFRLFNNKLMLETIRDFGKARFVIGVGAFVIYILALDQFYTLFNEEWVRRIATYWAGGICSGIAMQMIFNEYALERHLQQQEKPV